MLFQPDEENSKAVVKLIYTDKYGITVLGLETHAEMMAKIEQAKKDMAAAENSIPMRILEKVAQQQNKPRQHTRVFGRTQKPESVGVNFYRQMFGDDSGSSSPKRLTRALSFPLRKGGKKNKKSKKKQKK